MEALSYPRHQCMVYGGTPTDQLPALAQLLIKNLKANRRCFYLNSPEMVSELAAYLDEGGVKVENQITTGALILSSDQSHLVNGFFDIDRMLGMLKGGVAEAKSDGFSGLWASGDMTWELGIEINPFKLLEYEQRLESLFSECPDLFGVCQYHANTLSPQLLRVGLCTHKAISSEALSKLNPFYISEVAPEEIRADASIDEIKEMLKHLGHSFNTIQ